MQFSKKIERVLRSRIFWGIILPAVIFLICLSIFGFDYGIITISLFIGVPIFPTFILKGIGIDFSGKYSTVISLIISLLFYSGYVSFVCLIKKLKKKWLYWLSIIIILLAALGIRGCTQISGLNL